MKHSALAALSVTATIFGCSTDNHVHIASDTSLGINGTLDSTRTSGKVVIGYDRKFYAYIPQASPKEDVMSAYNCTNIVIDGIKVKKFNEQLATGAAAKKLVEDIPASGNYDYCGKNN